MSVCTQMSEKSYVRSLGGLQQLQNCNRSREFVKNSSLNIFNLLKRVWLFTFYFFFVELNLTNWPISTRRVMRHLWKGGESDSEKYTASVLSAVVSPYKMGPFNGFAKMSAYFHKLKR